MSGLTTSWYHATNIALHAIACVLVTKVSLAVASLRPGFAALTGLLFAAHPVHTEAVSNCQVTIMMKLYANYILFHSMFLCLLKIKCTITTLTTKNNMKRAFKYNYTIFQLFIIRIREY